MVLNVAIFVDLVDPFDNCVVSWIVYSLILEVSQN